MRRIYKSTSSKVYLIISLLVAILTAVSSNVIMATMVVILYITMEIILPLVAGKYVDQDKIIYKNQLSKGLLKYQKAMMSARTSALDDKQDEAKNIINNELILLEDRYYNYMEKKAGLEAIYELVMIVVILISLIIGVILVNAGYLPLLNMVIAFAIIVVFGNVLIMRKNEYL